MFGSSVDSLYFVKEAKNVFMPIRVYILYTSPKMSLKQNGDLEIKLE